MELWTCNIFKLRLQECQKVSGREKRASPHCVGEPLTQSPLYVKLFHVLFVSNHGSCCVLDACCCCVVFVWCVSNSSLLLRWFFLCGRGGAPMVIADGGLVSAINPWLVPSQGKGEEFSTWFILFWFIRLPFNTMEVVFCYLAISYVIMTDYFPLILNVNALHLY